MNIDFNNLRKQACHSYDSLVEKLNAAILKTDQWALPNDVHHGHEINIKGYVLIDADEIERDLIDLKAQIAAIAMVYEPGHVEFADVYEKPLVDFNP